MADVDYFLKIDGIEGESQDAKHKGEIDIKSWGWVVEQAPNQLTSGGLGAGRSQFGPLCFTAWISKASPKLFVVCATGDVLKKATLTCRKAGTDQQGYYKIILSDFLVSWVAQDGSGGARSTAPALPTRTIDRAPLSHPEAGGGDIYPIEHFQLSYNRIEFEYKMQKADGSLGGTLKVGYDLSARRPWAP
jgi:type VI secretion system secreted protein Hcp